MWIFGSVHRFRTVVLASSLVLINSAASLAAPALNATEPVGISGSGTEPFGLPTSRLEQGALRDKWVAVERELDDELLVLVLCQEDPLRCGSQPAQQLLTIVDKAGARQGRARLGEVNRAINLAIRPMSDLEQYGSVDVWSSPLATFATGAGDCEDYAIAKFVALRIAGVAAEDLRLVILRDTLRQEDHAVVAARLAGHWLMLDNRRMAMIDDARFRNYRPTFVIDHQGVRQYAPMPLLLVEHDAEAGAARASAALPAEIARSRMPR